MKKSGFVALVGRPNSGKSTLLNRLLDMDISIVSPKAQTTRENLVGILNEPKGQICFVDTPGIHSAKEGSINEFMIHQAGHALESPNAVWYLLDPYSKLPVEKVVIDALARVKSPIFIVPNKADLPQNAANLVVEEVQNELKTLGANVQGVFSISALKNVGIQTLLNETWRLMPHGELYFPDTEQVTDKPMRFFAAELVREQLFLQLGDEVPYSCAVGIDRFDESLRMPRIEATIFVERDSQKGIVIGAKAAKIKAIGEKARGSIEKMMGTQVFLGLQVKVLKDWSKEPEKLKQLGYVI